MFFPEFVRVLQKVCKNIDVYVEGEPKPTVQTPSMVQMHTQEQRCSDKQPNVRMRALQQWKTAWLGQTL